MLLLFCPDYTNKYVPMELQKGNCFLCNNNKVIAISQAENAFDVICTLFSKEILNVTELKNIQSSLKICPICFHKLIILKSTSENIKTNDIGDEDTSKKCVLCKSGKVLFEISEWAVFNKISEDVVSKDKDAPYITCSDCLFYLDIRNQIKSKLISKYPQLRVKSTNGNENKRKSTNNSNVLPDAPAVLENKRRRRSAVDIKKNDSENHKGSPKQKSFNYDSIKKLKPLKHNRTLRRQHIVKSDSKFLNEIPCVLLKPFNLPNKHNKNAVNKTDDKEISAKTVHEEKQDLNSSKDKSASPEIKMTPSTLKMKIKMAQRCAKSIKLRREMGKHHIVKDLVVNLTKMNILQKHKKSRNYKPDPEIEKLIYKFNVLQRPTSPSTSKIIENSNENYTDVTKDTNDIKTKRKSVSFADEKNVEIEYYQNESSNVKRGKKSVVPEEDKEVETKNKESIDDGKDNEKSENNDDVTSESCEADERNNMSEEETFNDENGVTNEEDVDSPTHKKNKWKIKLKSVEPSNGEETAQENTETEVEETEIEKKPKREKPKPLSKKKSVKASNVEEAIQEHENNEVKEVDESELEKTPKREKPKPRSKKKSVKSSDVEETIQKHEKSEVEKVDESEVDETPKREKPKPRSKKKSVKSSDAEETVQEHEKSEVIEVDESDDETTPKREKPKPRSKKKSVKSSDGEETVQEQEKSEVEEVDETDVEKTPKKEKPKPRSKRMSGKPSDIEDSSQENEKTEAEKEVDENDENKKQEGNNLVDLENTAADGNSNDVNSQSEEEDKDGDSDTVADKAKQVASKDDGNTSNNEQKEFCKEIELDCKTKGTDTDVQGEDNLPTNDESCTNEKTKKDEADESKENRGDKSPSVIDNEDSNDGELEVAGGKESSSKKTTVDEDNEDECISGTKKDKDDDLEDGDESDKSKTELNNSKDQNGDENVNASSKDESENNENLDESKETGEDPTGDSKTDDSGKKIDTFESDSFSGSEKNDELGISEDDTKNINSILTGMFSQPDQSQDQQLDDWQIIEKDSDDKTNHKRKLSVDELNNSTDKKKKKVTFCEELT